MLRLDVRPSLVSAVTLLVATPATAKDVVTPDRFMEHAQEVYDEHLSCLIDLNLSYQFAAVNDLDGESRARFKGSITHYLVRYLGVSEAVWLSRQEAMDRLQARQRVADEAFNAADASAAMLKIGESAERGQVCLASIDYSEI